MKLSKTLEISPSEWGDRSIVDQRDVDQLRACGDDWQDASLADCETITRFFVTRDFAIYAGSHTLNNGCDASLRGLKQWSTVTDIYRVERDGTMKETDAETEMETLTHAARRRLQKALEAL